MTSDTLFNTLQGILYLVLIVGMIYAFIFFIRLTKVASKMGGYIGTTARMTIRDNKIPSAKAVGKEQTRQEKLSVKYVKVYYIIGMIIGILFIVWGISRFRLAGTMDDDGNRRGIEWAVKGGLWFILGVVLFIVFLILLLIRVLKQE